MARPCWQITIIKWVGNTKLSLGMTSKVIRATIAEHLMWIAAAIWHHHQS